MITRVRPAGEESEAPLASAGLAKDASFVAAVAPIGLSTQASSPMKSPGRSGDLGQRHELA